MRVIGHYLLYNYVSYLKLVKKPSDSPKLKESEVHRKKTLCDKK